jgi:hypothetical protein
MGLADRDYMRERARERAESRGAVYADRSRRSGAGMARVLTIVAGVALLACIAVLLFAGEGRKGTMGAMNVATTDEITTPRPTAPDVGVERTSGQPFPESGTVEWGDEGQPIGGRLERLEIWDVTRSEQAKVVHIRSGPGSTFAIVYMAPGKRVTLMVPSSRAYQVTATSGPVWNGPAERFGTDGTTVDFGMVNVFPGRPGVVAMGAPDQQANVVTSDRF